MFVLRLTGNYTTATYERRDVPLPGKVRSSRREAGNF